MSLQGTEKGKENVHNKNTEISDLTSKLSNLKVSESSKSELSGSGSQSQPIDIHHKNTEIRKPKHKPGKIEKEIDIALKEELDITREEDKQADFIHKQGEQIGRIHNKVDNTNHNLHEGEQTLAENNSCCLSIWDSFKAALSCCCAPKTVEPHHDSEFNKDHPKPVVFSQSKPKTSKPKEREEKIKELAEAAKHNLEAEKKIGEELDAGNFELKEIVKGTEQAKETSKKMNVTGKKLAKK